ncbi:MULTISPECIES: hypothetical protein [unclassified Mesorhizobium]|uniref:hypothetical protein n=1 Tax=unclassified Mesorhizobium TaxID=325217 RepID=UPI000FD84D9E|nr:MULTISPECIES: hypothetical protein [unclassified Mesorhizobium]TGR58274.1 hypothetical protein EN842_01390 [bacterium M00.F.Ca.ET.199.01.1.1]TGU41618.1 hypothetical protein EN799_03425 [bacterium M00.F.Ca.ET.156.01.1.1]TGV89758.1 hypothetical protein EN792_006260 [Mesorhizobium sp. M00.F.Ca.ET.149.01.1.1]TGR33016.1 hypothetical protein EN840_01390 [Mesorhizobium sp. M8A.F.Ca.ET.197.01.1.1]TGR34662.1 hypothetical protein EN845_01390 [Mesorhizobium sp. M8A.F.Ca.ET.202.01.1.1]
MRSPYSFDHIRQKDGEPLTEWFVRVVEWAIAESKGRVGRIRYALHAFEGLARDEERAAVQREADARLKRETEPLQKRIAELEHMLRGTVSKTDAEAMWVAAAEAMRNKAEFFAMDLGEIPNSLSEAIGALPLPKLRWISTTRG